jgi:DNA polymerase III gamma/tau subunit
MADSEPLITRYRPSDWDEVIGNEAPLAALRRAIASQSRPHSYLFTGPSGIGKTTLARILAKELQADVLEIDAASNNGVDAIREIVEFGQHMAFSENGRRLFIIDEAHMLSRAAFNALLITLETPPPHLYLALCTTERIKIIETVITRCYECALKPLSAPEIEDLLSVVCDLEEWQVHPDVLALAIQAATGQPRKALSIIQQIHDAPNREEARRIITLIEASDPMIELLQFLLSGGKAWLRIRPLLARIEAEAFEGAEIAAGRYISGALMQANDEPRARRIWQMLDALIFPSSTYDKKVAFIAAIGRIVWGGE